MGQSSLEHRGLSVDWSCTVRWHYAEMAFASPLIHFVDRRTRAVLVNFTACPFRKTGPKHEGLHGVTEPRFSSTTPSDFAIHIRMHSSAFQFIHVSSTICTLRHFGYAWALLRSCSCTSALFSFRPCIAGATAVTSFHSILEQKFLEWTLSSHCCISTFSAVVAFFLVGLSRCEDVCIHNVSRYSTVAPGALLPIVRCSLPRETHAWHPMSNVVGPSQCWMVLTRHCSPDVGVMNGPWHIKIC